MVNARQSCWTRRGEERSGLRPDREPAEFSSREVQFNINRYMASVTFVTFLEITLWKVGRSIQMPARTGHGPLTISLGKRFLREMRGGPLEIPIGS